MTPRQYRSMVKHRMRAVGIDPQQRADIRLAEAEVDTLLVRLWTAVADWHRGDVNAEHAITKHFVALEALPAPAMHRRQPSTSK
jgi:hypothetical protein